MAKKRRVIQIGCEGTRLVALEDLKELQGDLKQRSLADVEQLKQMILKLGFAFPFFVWRDGDQQWILDGHGRLAALTALRAEGWEVPPLPAVDIAATDMADAKRRLLALNSRYGKMTTEGFEAFVAGVELQSIAMDLALPEIDVSALTIGTSFVRPELSSDSSKPAPDGLWFYVEFYGQPERFEALKKALGGALKAGHEIDPEFFADLLEGGGGVP